MANLSERYRLMIYFAVGTLHLYRKDIVPLERGEGVEIFRKKNEATVKRVFDEALSLFCYELSYEQVDRAIFAYCAPAQSTSDTTVAPLA